MDWDGAAEYTLLNELRALEKAGLIRPVPSRVINELEEVIQRHDFKPQDQESTPS